VSVEDICEAICKLCVEKPLCNYDACMEKCYAEFVRSALEPGDGLHNLPQ